MNKRFDKHPDTISRTIHGKTFVVNYKTGNMTTLNDLGVDTWKKMPASLPGIAEGIAAEYDVSRNQAEQDVREFLDVLEQENLVVTDPEKKTPFPRSITGELTHLDKIEQLSIRECIPIKAKFELLYHCNLKCTHCANITERWRQGTLDTEGVKYIIDQLHDIGTMLISFTGGEIFTRKDLWEIIEYADEKDFLIELLTNASLMTGEDVERLKKYRVSNVQVSLYSHIPGPHDSITGVPGSFEKTINTLKYLTANKINTSISTPLMKINSRDCGKVRELAHQIGIKHYYSYNIFERDDGSTDVYDLRLSRDEMCEFFRENPAEIPYKKKDINDPICYAGTNQCSISPFGDVFPCFHTLLPIKLGNLTEQSLEDIWTNSGYLQHLRELKIYQLEGCPECPALSNCILCPGLNMKANRNLLKPARVCCDHAFSAREVCGTGYKVKGIRNNK